MEVTIQRDDLLRELAVADGIVSRKPTIPVLSSIRLIANGHGLRFESTDTDLAVCGPCAADVARPGAMLVPARKLFELAKTFQNAPVKLSSGDKGIDISASGFKGRFQTYPVDDYPSIASSDGQSMTLLPAAGLRELIARTRFAASAEDKRYFLNGALMEVAGSKLRMVATDGHRLAFAEVQWTGGEATSVILPKKALDALSVLLDDVDGDVTFSKSDKHIFFAVGDREFVARQVDGTFPAYSRVIPKSFTSSLTIDRLKMLDVLKRALIVAESSSRRAKLTFAPGSLSIASQSHDVGEGEEPIEVEYSGPERQVLVNGEYVREFLDIAETEQVDVRFSESNQPFMFESVGGDVVYRYVVMPQVI